MALAVPVGVHLVDDHGSRSAPEADRKSGPVEAAEALRQAARSGKDVQVTAWHTANSTTWAQPDGNLRTRTYSDTIRAHVGNEWRKVDTTLRRVDGGYAPKAVNDPLLFSAGGGQEDSRASRALSRPRLAAVSAASAADEEWTQLVRLTTGGHDLVVSWPGPLPAPVVDGPRALYENVRPDIDLLLTARDSGFSHVLIVHTREAAEDPLLSQLHYLLESASLKFELDEPSSTVSAKDGDGTEMAASPTPYMWDSSGKPAVTIGESTPAPDPAVTHPALALPGLAGPQPGTHASPLDADLSTDGRLAVNVDKKALGDPDMVYPVFIDPSFKGRKKNWTLLYESARNSSFWNGQNFNDGTNEARVGFETTTDGLSRSLFTFEFSSALHGASIKSATFRALQTYSWGCAARQYHLYLTGVISSSTTWANQPGEIERLSSGTNGHGYKSGSCPDAWVAHNVKSAADRGSRDRLSTLTMGLKAANESDTNAWKKFLANGESSPYIEIVYNRPPGQPTAQSMTPGPDCDVVSPYERVGKSGLTFRAKGSDPDGNLRYLHFRLWRTGETTKLVDKNVATDSTGYAHHYVEWTSLVHGATYSWDVRSVDTEGAVSTFAPDGTLPCRFIVDLEAPEAPTVTSDDFPEADATDSNWPDIRFGGSGTFTLAGATGAAKFEYGVNDTRLPSTVTATSGGAVITVRPPQAGPNVLYVQSVDTAGNPSARMSYHFSVAPRTEPDAPGDTSGDGHPDLLVIEESGRLKAYPSNGTGDIHDGMTASYDTGSGTPEAVADSYWKGALITHNGDWFHGDGVQDLVARMPDGELYIYPGDGFSGFDVAQRQRVLLPPNAPTSDKLTQILSIGDGDGDGLPDLFARYGPQLWIISGYSGGSFASAHQMTASAWDGRDIVLVDDVTGDGTADLVFRTHGTGRLLLREGKPDADGTGTDLLSLGLAGTSRTGTDAEYATGWSPTVRPLLMGTPDTNGDSVPDIWAMAASNGDVHVYHGSRSAAGTPRLVMDADAEGTPWMHPSAFG
ncbi:DNRLRE domain-containing protein [Streptomyces sp. NPDC006274]|uniref:DNRLRE domain-containing protein n=1 Tax=unclassified Streptomyces TaxID=2593676 RepID=UPI0033AB9447